MSKRNNSLTEHHVIPRGRGGTHKDVTLWPGKFHAAFHVVFGDLTPDECMELVACISTPGTFWTGTKLRDLRRTIKKEKEKKTTES
jgi:hypothetical protein